MALFKCKMCGAPLEISAGETVIKCEHCGTMQTLPKLDDDKRANLYDRANHFRRNNDFDKAMGIYEQILNEDNTDAEAYWSLVLCRFGIEYVEDPATQKRIPTVNRAQFTSIFDDDNYKSALEYADSSQRRLYEEEAKTINNIQRGILAISQKEEPFDVFICYKETDSNGRRTHDSVLAQDLYYQLKQEGFKVFFARITLEDKLGSAYEPYIFAALNSAKVMVVLGTKPEFFNAVWVKNEWSRYLALIKQGQKKMLIPAYKDMNPYDLPEEFSHLQAQDMSKLGFMQDLIRGIKKIVKADEPKATKVQATSGASANVTPLLKRAFMFLEDGDWASANEYCEKVLDIDPENARAYLGKLLVDFRVPTQEKLKELKKPFDDDKNYVKIMRFDNGELKATLEGYNAHIRNGILDEEYSKAALVMECATAPKDYMLAAELFKKLKSHRDAEQMVEACYEKAEILRKDIILYNAIQCMGDNDIPAYEQARDELEGLRGWRNANDLIVECAERIAELTALELETAEQQKIADEKARIDAEKRMEQDRARRIAEAKARAEKQAYENKKSAQKAYLKTVKGWTWAIGIISLVLGVLVWLGSEFEYDFLAYVLLTVGITIIPHILAFCGMSMDHTKRAGRIVLQVFAALSVLAVALITLVLTWLLGPDGYLVMSITFALVMNGILWLYMLIMPISVKNRMPSKKYIRNSKGEYLHYVGDVYIGKSLVPADTVYEISDLLKRGERLQAVKIVRELTNMGLEDAKKWVENYRDYDLNKPQ